MQDIILQENKCTTFLIWSLFLRSPFYFCLSDLKVTRGITSKISNELMIDKQRSSKLGDRFDQFQAAPRGIGMVEGKHAC